MKKDGKTGRQRLVHAGTVPSQISLFLLSLQARLNNNPAEYN
jgi:hypothetical protein